MPFPGQPAQPSTQERKQVDPSPEKKKASTTTVTTTKEVPKELPKEVPQQEDEESSSEEEDASSEEEEGEESQENASSAANPYAGMSHSISQDTKSSPPRDDTPKPAKEPVNGDAVKRKIEETTTTSDDGDREDPPKRSKKKSTGPSERILYSASYAFQTEDERGKVVITKLPVYIVNGDKVVFATQDLRDIANHNMRIKGEEGKCQITVDKSNKTAAEYEYLVSYLKAHLNADNDVFEVMKRAHDQIMKEWEEHKKTNAQTGKKTESEAAPVVHKTEKKSKAPSTKTKKQSANNNVVEQPPVDRMVEDKVVVVPKAAEQPQATHIHVRKLNLIPPNPVDYLVGDSLKQYRAALNEYFDILQGMN